MIMKTHSLIEDLSQAFPSDAIAEAAVMLTEQIKI
jgi:hypothetical protein